MVVEDGHAHSRRITGIRDLGTEVKVSDGVKQGDRVSSPHRSISRMAASYRFARLRRSAEPRHSRLAGLSGIILPKFTTVNTGYDVKVLKSPGASVPRNGAAFLETRGNARSVMRDDEFRRYAPRPETPLPQCSSGTAVTCAETVYDRQKPSLTDRSSDSASEALRARYDARSSCCR